MDLTTVVLLKKLPGKMTLITLMQMKQVGWEIGTGQQIKLTILIMKIFSLLLKIVRDYFKDGEITLHLVHLNQLMNHGGALQKFHSRTCIEKLENLFRDMLLKLISYSMIHLHMIQIDGMIFSEMTIMKRLQWIIITTGHSREILTTSLQSVIKLNLKQKKHYKSSMMYGLENGLLLPTTVPNISMVSMMEVQIMKITHVVKWNAQRLIFQRVLQLTLIEMQISLDHSVIQITPGTQSKKDYAILTLFFTIKPK